MTDSPKEIKASLGSPRILAACLAMAALALAWWLWPRAIASMPSDAQQAGSAQADPAQSGAEQSASPPDTNADEPKKITKTDAEWRAQLTPEQYLVTRMKGTERAYTGAYWNNHDAGIYKCVCCGAVLFGSENKFDSECGWPSFSAPAKPGNLQTSLDLSLSVPRTEVTCRQCGAHLGHVFDDGPQPSGLRYCMNSAALNLEKRDSAPPAKPQE